MLPASLAASLAASLTAPIAAPLAASPCPCPCPFLAPPPAAIWFPTPPKRPQVTQGAIRSVAARVFSHLHGMDLAFHLSRQTGAVSRVIDRGTRGINFILRCGVWDVLVSRLARQQTYACDGGAQLRPALPAPRTACVCTAVNLYCTALYRTVLHAPVLPRSSMVFNVVPTAFEVALVAGILAVKCGAPFAALTGATIVAYTAFTFSITQVGLPAGCGRRVGHEPCGGLLCEL